MQDALPIVLTIAAGQTETRDIAGVERDDRTPTTLGRTLAAGKALLTALQAVVGEPQLTADLQSHRPGGYGGRLPRRTG